MHYFLYYPDQNWMLIWDLNVVILVDYNGEIVVYWQLFSDISSRCLLALKPASGPFYKHALPLIPALISNYIRYKVWDEISYPITNFNGRTVEVGEWISKFVPHFTWECDYLSTLGLKLIHVSKNGPRRYFVLCSCLLMGSAWVTSDCVSHTGLSNVVIGNYLIQSFPLHLLRISGCGHNEKTL